MADRLSTGVDVIDRHMQGGVPVESLLAFAAPPESQSDLLLAAAAAMGETLYLTAGRTAAAVDERLGDLSGVTVQTVDPAALAANPAETLSGVPSHGYLVVDHFEEFERLDHEGHRDLLRELSARVRARESVGIVHGVKQDTRTAARRRTLQFADVVWHLHLAVSTLAVETRLTVTKVRGGKPHPEPIKLKLTDWVSVDTSRDIA